MSRPYSPRRASGWTAERVETHRAKMREHYASPEAIERAREAGKRASHPARAPKPTLPGYSADECEAYRLFRQKRFSRAEALGMLGLRLPPPSRPTPQRARSPT